ncbi:MAG: metal ABC transporter permease [Phycisphaerae bacterium]
MTALTGLDLWTMAIGAMVNVACAVLGCYLVLRRLSLLGDAISHAVLPGLAVAFMVAGSRAMVPMFLGAMVAGVLTAFLSETIHRVARVKHDASMGVVFTSLFALGVILITRAAHHVDLDARCVFYGSIELLPLDVVSHFGMEAPVRFWSMGLVLLLVIGFVVALWKELRIVSFDATLAVTLGINAAVVHYLLMGMVAGTVVAAFEAVGSILVVAMLIAPGAAAHLLTDRLWLMLVLAAAQGVVAAVVGTVVAVALNTSVAGMMAVVAGGQFAVAVVAAPRYGLVSAWLRRVRLSFRIVTEDALALLYRWGEASERPALSAGHIANALGRGLVPRTALGLLRLRRFVEPFGDGVVLTDGGLRRARGLVRSHRLWESYLAKHFGLAADHLHEPAERMEHFITAEMETDIVEDIRDAARDPHGRPIPKQG